MSRLYRARVSVSEHHAERAAVIGAALAEWQEGASVTEGRGANGELTFDATFGLTGGWPASAAAKSQAYRIGQANGVPCRVGWTVWQVDAGGQVRIEWGNEEEAPGLAGIDAGLTGERELLVSLSITPSDDARSMQAEALVKDWLAAPDPYGCGVLKLADGERFLDVVGRWRNQVSEVVGPHDMTVSVWDLDRPEEALLFTPDLFPAQEPAELLRPDDWMIGTLPRFGRCMFCANHEDLRLVGYRSDPPDPELKAAGIRTLPGRKSIAICGVCQVELGRRLEPVAPEQVGLYESDGCPMGLLHLPADLACWTCNTPVRDVMIVVNDDKTVGACRRCLMAAQPMRWDNVLDPATSDLD